MKKIITSLLIFCSSIANAEFLFHYGTSVNEGKEIYWLIDKASIRVNEESAFAGITLKDTNLNIIDSYTLAINKSSCQAGYGQVFNYTFLSEYIPLGYYSRNGDKIIDTTGKLLCSAVASIKVL